MTNKHRCIICIGSNYRAHTHIDKACRMLEDLFPAIQWGETIETPSEGGPDKGNYLNRAAILLTECPPNKIKEQFKFIENILGRTSECKETGIIPIDIDLLKIDTQIVKPADLKKGYVQQALKSLRPNKKNNTQKP